MLRRSAEKTAIRKVPKARALAAGLALALAALAPTPALALYQGFSDCEPDAWYATDGGLKYMVEQGFISGYGDSGTFGPYDTLTRAQTAKILWCMAGEPTASAEAFSDMDQASWAKEPILWARSVGVIQGYGSSNLFGPNDTVTREQLCVMLGRYIEKVEGGTVSSDCKKLDSMPDGAMVSSYARTYVGWALDQGIISGESRADGKYINPQGGTWRASMAKMGAVFHRDILPTYEEPGDAATLKAIIENCSKLEESNYTSESWSTFASALINAKSVAADSSASQSKIDAATTKLTDAFSGLAFTELVDTTGLKASVETAEAIDASSYSEASYATLQAKLASAKKVLSSSNATWSEVNAANEELATAIDALEPLDNEAKKAKELATAKAEFEAAKQALAYAEDREDKAFTEAQTACDNWSESTTTNGGSFQLLNARNRFESAEKELAAAKEAQEAAQAAYDKVVAENESGIKEYETAVGNLEYYEKKLSDTETKLSEAKTKLTSTKAAWEKAESAYSAALDAKGATYRASNGTRDFFLWLGDSSAVEVLDNEAGYTSTTDGAPFNKYTDPTSSNDATNLKNVARAIEMMKKCNSLRTQNGKSVLKVNTRLMAVAEVDANWSCYNWGIHAGSVGNNYSGNGENLAIGYKNPFDAWYTAEKKLYDAGERNFTKIGHYLNTISESYAVTGFGYSGYRGVDCQQFGTSQYSNYYGKTYTINEFEELFNQYYGLVTNVSGLEDLEKAATETKASYEEALENYTSLETSYNVYKARVEKYQEKVEALKPAGIDSAKAELDSANEALSTAQTTYNEANKTYTALKTAQEKAEARKQALKETYESSYASYGEIYQQYTEAHAALTAAYDKLEKLSPGATGSYTVPALRSKRTPEFTYYVDLM